MPSSVVPWNIISILLEVGENHSPLRLCSMNELFYLLQSASFQRITIKIKTQKTHNTRVDQRQFPLMLKLKVRKYNLDKHCVLAYFITVAIVQT